jgi:hypothetical protein
LIIFVITYKHYTHLYTYHLYYIYIHDIHYITPSFITCWNQGAARKPYRRLGSASKNQPPRSPSVVNTNLGRFRVRLKLPWFDGSGSVFSRFFLSHLRYYVYIYIIYVHIYIYHMYVLFSYIISTCFCIVKHPLKHDNMDHDDFYMFV